MTTCGEQLCIRTSSDEAIARDIALEIERSVRVAADAGREVVDLRLAQLDREWPLEKVLTAKLGGLAALGGVLGLTGSRKWFLLSTLAGTGLVQHALGGRGATFSALRRLGFRTQAEIDTERRGLLAARDGALPSSSPRDDAEATSDWADVDPG